MTFSFGIRFDPKYEDSLESYLANSDIPFRRWDEGEVLLTTQQDADSARAWISRLEKLDRHHYEA